MYKRTVSEWTRCGSISSLKKIEASETKRRKAEGWKTLCNSFDIERVEKKRWAFGCVRYVVALDTVYSTHFSRRQYQWLVLVTEQRHSLLHTSEVFSVFRDRWPTFHSHSPLFLAQLRSSNRLMDGAAWQHKQKTVRCSIIQFACEIHINVLNGKQSLSNEMFLCNRKWHKKCDDM